MLLGPALGKLLSELRHCTENWQYPDPSEVAGLAFLILYMVSILLLLPRELTQDSCFLPHCFSVSDYVSVLYMLVL